MTTNSSIEWTDLTWNPVTGCTKVSRGCDRCYAETVARRFSGGTAFPDGFAVTLHPERLDAPHHWRTPRRVFVNSMSDLFHDAVPAAFVARVFAVMAATPQHTYQLLTKRPGRMRSLLGRAADTNDGPVALMGAAEDEPSALALLDTEDRWPLPNVWVGVSAESQRWADVRTPVLLDTAAAVRWVSAEPLLGPVDLSSWLAPDARLCGPRGATAADLAVVREFAAERLGCRGLDWVVAGGESGAGARPVDLGWVRSIRDQCGAAGVPLFVKQTGSAWARRHGHRGKGASKGQDPATWPDDLRIRQMPDRPPAAAQAAPAGMRVRRSVDQDGGR